MLDAGPAPCHGADVLELAELTKRITDGSIDTVVVAFPDMQGRPVGKRVTGRFFLDHVLEHGIEACDYLLAVDVDMDPLPGYRFTNWDTGYGDVVALPDLSTLRLLPWLEGSAMVVCDVVDTAGVPVEVSPRRVLRRQMERARELGFDVRCATELEFYLFQETFEEAAALRWHGLHPHVSSIEDYQLLQTSREEYVLRRIRNEMVAADIPVEFSKGEAGRGQHEVNVTYGGALEVADRHLVFKNGVKEIADQCGRSASFMAKWSMDEVGSSCHIHASLWDAESGAPRMAGDDDASQLSPEGRQFVAGLLLGARQLTWLWAPYVNSYKRYVPGSWAPTAAVWGVDNRTCGFRLVGTGRGPARRVPHPRRRRQPLPGPGRHLRRRAVGGGARPRAASALRGQRLRRHRRGPGADDPGRGHRRARVVVGGACTPSVTTSTTICSTRPARNGRGPTGPSPTGSWPELRAHLIRLPARGAAPTRPGQCRFSRRWICLVCL